MDGEIDGVVRGWCLLCAQCVREGHVPALGTAINNNPPFALVIADGETRCSKHLVVS